MRRIILALLIYPALAIAAMAQQAPVNIGQLPNGGIAQQTDLFPIWRNGKTMHATPFLMPGINSVLISTGNLAPGGVMESDGNCLVGASGAWTTGPCGTGLLSTANTWTQTQTFPANSLTLGELSQIGENTILANFTANPGGNVTASTVPSCLDTAGNHLNYIPGTGLTCGTTSSSGGTVTGVTGTSPIASSGGTAPAISCPTCVTASGGGALTATSPVTVSGAGLIAISGVTAEQGNGAKIQLSTGATTTNDCVKFDANGNTVDAGAACGSGGGGTVASLTGDSVVYNNSASTGAVTLSLATQTANKIFAGPTSGGAATPTFRSLVGADLPNPGASSLGGIQSIAGVTHQWIASISTSGVPALSQPACGDLSNSGTACQAATGTSGATVPLLNGNNVHSGTNVFSGAVPTLASGQGVIAGSSTLGGILTGQGSVDDITLQNKNAATVCTVATSTTNLNCTGLQVAGTPVLTGNQTITLSGDASGSGTSAIAVTNTKLNGAAVPTSATLLSSNGSNQLIAATYQGNGTKAQLSTGSTTSGDVVNFDANGNTVDAGYAAKAGKFSIATNIEYNYGGL